jgi:hypothetical protein
MSYPNDRYLAPAYSSPKSPYQSPTTARNTASIPMARSSSYDPHKVLGYFDIPSRSAPSSPQTTFLPFPPMSRSSSPARDVRRSIEYNPSHSGSDLEDALVGFSLVPNWLKMAMEQDRNSQQPSTAQKININDPHGRLHSPDSLMTTSNETTPVTPRTPQLMLTIPKTKDLVSSPQNKTESQKQEQEDDDRRYWEEEDEGYFGEMEEGEDEDLEECYRSVF